ncbi:MAG: Serine acetyltransferase [bacterium ADurb.Bin363]|nr:MAG: Serine acetyltransferase [bacterium ADurb.Bin363]
MKNNNKKNLNTYDTCKRVIMEQDNFSHELPPIVEELIQTTEEPNSTDHVGYSMIPSTQSIIDILKILDTIIYPGYFGHQELYWNTLSYYLGNQLSKLYNLLSSQIAKSLMHECAAIKEGSCKECVLLARQESARFIKKLPELRKVLAMDVEATYTGDPAAKSKEEIIFCYPGLKAITVYRLAHELLLQKIPMLPRIMTEYAHSITGADIHPGAKIGNYFFIDHATGVVIGETTEIGKNVRIYQSVTLGALSFPKDADGNIIRNIKRHPTIEDDVIIYSNATILGGNTVIGKGSIIGGNVWITESIPPYTKVIHEIKKQKIIPMKVKS